MKQFTLTQILVWLPSWVKRDLFQSIIVLINGDFSNQTLLLPKRAAKPSYT